MNTLVEILSPGFLLREALIGSVLVGGLCPLVGVYFVLRRMIFLGVALPQLSSAGIALAFLVYRMFVGQHQHFAPSERWLALLGALSCTLVGLLILAMLARYRDMVEARIGITYALAAAATLLFLALDPAAEAHMVNLLKGDILATTGPSLTLMAGAFSAVALVLLVFRKEFLLVSFDRDLAVVFGKYVGLWDSLLYLMIGITISLGVRTAGPIVTFGFLVIPPLTARMLHTPYADLLTDRGESRRDDGVCWVLLCLSLRSATWTCRGGAGEPGRPRSRSYVGCLVCWGGGRQHECVSSGSVQHLWSDGPGPGSPLDALGRARARRDGSDRGHRPGLLLRGSGARGRWRAASATAAGAALRPA